MSQKTEIERRFLLKELPIEVLKMQSFEIFQAYLPQIHDDTVTRARHQVDTITRSKAFFLIDKIRKTEMTNVEVEKFIDEAGFNQFLELAYKGISKERFLYRDHDNLTWEIDFFLRSRKAIVEVELPFETYTLKVPNFIAAATDREVTKEKEFSNFAMATELELKEFKQNFLI